MKTTWLYFPMWLLVAISLAFTPALRTKADSDKSRGSRGGNQRQQQDDKKEDKKEDKKDSKKDSKGDGKHDDKGDDDKDDDKGDDDKDDDDKGRKVTICHKGHTIEVSRKALKAHLRHGDTLGSCEVTPSKNR